MARAHVRYTVTDRAGNAIQNATCTFYLTGTSTLVNDLYSSPTSGSPVTSAAFITNNEGEVEAWMTTPKTIDVQISDTAHAAYYSGAVGTLLTWTSFTETLEIQPPPENVGQLDGTQGWTGANTFSGTATFTGTVTVPAAALPESAVANLTADLAAKVTTATYFLSGTRASRPAAGVVHRLYFATDTLQWFRDDGAAWHEVVMAEHAAFNDTAAWVDVRARNLKVDGTTDDASALQTMVTSMAGGEVFWPMGTCVLGSQVNLGAYVWHFVGRGEGLSVLQGKAATSIGALLFMNNGTLILDNLTVDGNSANVTNANNDTTQIGVEVNPSSAAGAVLDLRHVTVSNFWGHGVRCVGTASNAVYVNVTGIASFLNNGRNGALFTYCTRIAGGGIIANQNGLNVTIGGFSGVDFDRCSNISLASLIANQNGSHGLAQSNAVGDTEIAISSVIANSNGTAVGGGYGVNLSTGVSKIAMGTVVTDGNHDGGFNADALVGGGNNDMYVVRGSVGTLVAINSTAGHGVVLNYVSQLSFGSITACANSNYGIGLNNCYLLNLGSGVIADNGVGGILMSAAAGTQTYKGSAQAPGRIKIGKYQYLNNANNDLNIDPSNKLIYPTVDDTQVASISGTYALQPNFGYTSVSGATSTPSLTLPDSTSVVAQYRVRNYSGNALAITNPAGTIDGAASLSLPSGSMAILESDGTTSYRSMVAT